MIKRIFKTIGGGQNSKTFWKIFFLVLIVNIIILNWNDLFWLFHRQAVVERLQLTTTESVPVFEYHPGEDRVEISAINILAPLIIPTGQTTPEIDEALDRGITHFPGSALPGEEGIVVLLGHSAPPGWPKIKHDWVFSDVNDLKEGDKIEVYFQNQRFIYSVTERVFLEIGEEIPAYQPNEREIILLSCWPPGRNIKRIGIKGVLTK